ncbi:hypothetical protein HMI54_012085 [Coelomomyces lativittatus]|nr:hypothetical protein HMI55_004925 [Coelomomyces lativittatus]KAJ1515573.1 hypothetical protein HMI54_012085 [Coelomomyces lativittatus]KAJ1515836.1 hypothetical protein HMI56_000310 [Coelomomyces lativittatus]
MSRFMVVFVSCLAPSFFHVSTLPVNYFVSETSTNSGIPNTNNMGTPSNFLPAPNLPQQLSSRFAELTNQLQNLVFGNTNTPLPLPMGAPSPSNLMMPSSLSPSSGLTSFGSSLPNGFPNTNNDLTLPPSFSNLSPSSPNNPMLPQPLLPLMMTSLTGPSYVTTTLVNPVPTPSMKYFTTTVLANPIVTTSSSLLSSSGLLATNTPLLPILAASLAPSVSLSGSLPSSTPVSKGVDFMSLSTSTTTPTSSTSTPTKLSSPLTDLESPSLKNGGSSITLKNNQEDPSLATGLQSASSSKPQNGTMDLQSTNWKRPYFDSLALSKHSFLSFWSYLCLHVGVWMSVQFIF